MAKKVMMGFEPIRINRKMGNVPTKATIGGKFCCFRSKLEHNFALYLQFLKEQGEIKDWLFEKTMFVFKDEIKGAKQFLVDFDVLNNDGSFEYFETKGWLQGSDVTKFRRLQKYRPEVKITLVMLAKSNKQGIQNRLRQMDKYTERIMYWTDIAKQLKGFLRFI